MSLGQLYITDSKRDIHGNLYVYGTYSGDFRVAGKTFAGSPGVGNVILLKFNKNNVLQWGTSSLAFTNGLVSGQMEFDSFQNVVLTGYYDASGFEFGCKSVTSDSGVFFNMYFSKVDVSGNVLWLKTSFGGAVTPYALDVDNDGSFVVSASYRGANLSFGNVAVPSVSVTAILIVKFNKNGEPVWARSFASEVAAGDHALSMSIDNEGDIAITGYFTGAINFDGFVLKPKVVSQNYFIVKLSDEGRVIWAQTTDSDDASTGLRLTMDSDNNIYTVGRFANNDMILEGFTLLNKGRSDSFIIKYSPEGDIRWARSFGGSKGDQIWGADFHESGKIAVLSMYGSDDYEVGSSVFKGENGFSDILVTELDVDGSILCNYQYNSITPIYSADVYYDSLGNLTFVKETLVPFNIQNIEAIGDSDDWLPENPIFIPELDLGLDLEICHGDLYPLTVDLPCNATIVWSDGSERNTFEVKNGGVLWAEMDYLGQTVRDSIKVSVTNPIDPLNLPDKTICGGDSYKVDLTTSNADQYLWNDGFDSPIRTITDLGKYTVVRSNGCFNQTEEFNVSFRKPIQVELGADTVSCSINSIVVDATHEEADWYKWSNGSQSPQITVDEPGNYSVVVGNVCESVSATKKIGLELIAETEIPNVITPNGDGFNEFFELPEDKRSQLRILNRWGNVVYSNDSYDNSWDAKGLSSGVYFYQVKDGCGGTFAGNVSVLR